MNEQHPALRDYCQPRDLWLFAQHKEHPRFESIVAQATELAPETLEGSLVDAFGVQVGRHGTRVAVEDGERSLTYAELNTAANRLAHRLLAEQASNDAPIAAIVEKRVEAIIALVAIWKAGHSVMFLEPDMVPAQLRRHLSNTGVMIAIGHHAHSARLANVLPPQCRLLPIEDALSPGSHGTSAIESEADPQVSIAPEHPAIMNQTSGSTGEPKYVLHSHRNRLYFAWDIAHSYLLSPLDRHSLFHQLSSSSAPMIYVPALVTGGTICLFDVGNLSMRALVPLLDKHRITHLSLPNVAMRELLHALEGKDNLPGVRMIQLTGQTLYRSDVMLFQERMCEGTILISRYAMSEVGGSAQYQIDHTSKLESPTVPAGYPFPGRKLYIVDEQGEMLPPNTVGEIALDCPLPGFWHTLRLQRMPIFGQATDGKPIQAFHTGDMGMIQPDGCVIHLGRKDDVVKVRGNRISLVEVENALLSVPGVGQAAAKTFPTARGDNRLVGYVAPQDNAASQSRAPLTPNDLRRHLAQQVAAPVIPSRFVIMDALPLTGSGKPNRKVLPEPGNPRPDLDTPYRAPHTEIESALCKIWVEHLELDEVGIDDDFFALGGDSILMMELVVTVERKWAKELPPTFFNNPTVANLARQLQNENTKSETRAVYPPPIDVSIHTSSHTSSHTETPPETDLQAQQSPPARPLTSANPEGTAPTWRRRLYARLVETGPTWKYHLSYSMGIHLQRRLVAQRAFRRRFFPRAVARLRAWHELLEDATPLEEVTRQFLLCNTWQHWRLATLRQNPAHFARWVTIEGEEHLSELDNGAPERAGAGLILLTPHTLLERLVPLLPQWAKRQHMTITGAECYTREELADINHPRRMARRAQQVAQAHTLLTRQGVVKIVGDGPAGYGGISIALGNRRLEIRAGAAELAWETGATVLPVFATLAPTGQITLHLTAPIRPGSGTRQAQIERMTEEYAHRYAQFWPRQYASMTRGFLDEFWKLPRI